MDTEETKVIKIKLSLLVAAGLIRMDATNFELHFTPDQARNLSRNLIAAADKLDQLQGTNVKKKRHGR